MGTRSTTKPQPQFLVCGPIYFIMTSVPLGWLHAINTRERAADMNVQCFNVDRRYLVLIIEVNPCVSDDEHEMRVRDELQFVWNLLYRYDLAAFEEMPEPKAGNPAMMALDPSDLSPIQRMIVGGDAGKFTAARIVGRRMVRPT